MYNWEAYLSTDIWHTHDWGAYLSADVWHMYNWRTYLSADIFHMYGWVAYLSAGIWHTLWGSYFPADIWHMYNWGAYLSADIWHMHNWGAYFFCWRLAHVWLRSFCICILFIVNDWQLIGTYRDLFSTFVPSVIILDHWASLCDGKCEDLHLEGLQFESRTELELV